MRIFALLIAFLFSCSSNSEMDFSQKQFIYGRGDSREIALYMIQTPDTWSRRDPLPEDLNEDTTKSLTDFIIDDPEGYVRVAIHNFPTDHIDKRVPVQAQVARWKNQISDYDEVHSFISPIGIGGYSGLLFVGMGNPSTIAVALQLPPDTFRRLSGQIRADVTIKAVGSKELMTRYQQDILDAINSFGLIEEIPKQR